MTVVQSLFAMLFLIHVMGWAWILIGRNRENSWLKRYSEFSERGIDSLYPYYAAVYYITTTVTTIGFGEILPNDNLEILFIMMLELLGLAIFSYIIGTLKSVEGSESVSKIISSKEENIKEFLNKVNSNWKHADLPSEIYKNSIENLELIHDYGIKYVIGLFGFSEQLNPRLRNQIVYENLKNIYLEFLDFFSNHEINFQSDDKFILSFLSNLECQVFLPNKRIIERGEQLEYIYLIAKGSVQVLSHGHKNWLAILPQYWYFGDYQIFLDARSNVSFYASPIEKAFLYVLSKNIFLDLCREYEDHLNFYMKRALETRKLFKRLIIKRNLIEVS